MLATQQLLALPTQLIMGGRLGTVILSDTVCTGVLQTSEEKKRKKFWGPSASICLQAALFLRDVF